MISENNDATTNNAPTKDAATNDAAIPEISSDPSTATSTQATSTRATSTRDELSTVFEPHDVEARWYAFWQQNNYFAPPSVSNTAKTYVITIPPPNVTGVLHLGHALQHSVHDCLLRFHRMRGDRTLCVPGTDHAGIATQIKVEAQLQSETGQTRQEIGREAFVEKTYAWKERYGATIIDQMKRLGCSYDWSRERFTMDDGYVRAVMTVFKQWYDEGLIYRGYRLVNWSPGAQTNVSDLEIEFREVAGKLWHFKYPVENSDEFIIVATTRPETMLGDTAVAVHPDDKRYAHLVGKSVSLPLTNRKIPIVADSYVDKEFGTGAVKVTPAHDPNDYEIGQRHGLETISVIGFEGRMTEAAGNEYSKLTNVEARHKVIADLNALGLLEKTDDYTHSVGHCARTGTVIEPLLSEQWFVRMKELARPVADAIRMGRVKYVPERFANTSLDWMDNIRDWNISRQLWWGHRIPVYYGPNGEIEVSVEPITRAGWTQDEDVLDTWFSSALWPFAVLGWPDNLESDFYPTDVLITGRDILNLWVSRMILTSLHFVDNTIPFHHVFVHPTVQDVFGLRMSKSLGTGIDPMELIEIYGADATRFGLLQLATGAQDVRFIDRAEEALGESAVRRWLREHKGEPLPLQWNEKPSERYPQMQNARGFANKIWNAARFVSSNQAAQTNLDSIEYSNREDSNREDSNREDSNREDSNREDSNRDLSARWILSRLNATLEDVTRALENYEFETATSALYSFIWNDFCDWFVELSKPKLRENDASQVALLNHILEVSMRLLHPFMPFLSEEIWARLPKNDDVQSLCIAAWPTTRENDAQAERDFALVQETVRAVRNLRAEAKLPPSQKLNVQLFATSQNAHRVLDENKNVVAQLSNAGEVSVSSSENARPENAISTTFSEVEVWLPLEGLIDRDKESARLQRELDGLQKDFKVVSTKLNNPQFVDKAPAAVVEKDRARLTELQNAIDATSTRLQEMKTSA